MRFPTLAALIAFSSLAHAQELVRDTPIGIELKATDPLLEGRGPSRTFEYDVTFDGWLYVWARSSDFDPILRVTSSDGELLAEDDDSGGGTTACVALQVSTNELPSIAVSGKTASACGKLVLHVSEAPETDATRAAAERATAVLAQLQVAGESREIQRAKIATALAELLAARSAEHSGTVASAAADLGWVAHDHGDAQSACNALERDLAFLSFVLPDEHPSVQEARLLLATALKSRGDPRAALALERKLVEILSRTLPPDHRELQRARMNLGVTLWTLGDLPAARALFEQVLEVFSRTLSEDHPDLVQARSNLGLTLLNLGDLAAARVLLEESLEVCTRKLPDDHPNLQDARQALGSLLATLGDLAAARELFTKVVEVDSRTLADDDARLQRARLNLANALKDLSDFAAARQLQEKVLEVYSRTLPDDHPDVQLARGNLAVTLLELGDLRGARELQEKVVDARSRTMPADSLDVSQARANLAVTLHRQGDFASARALEEKVLEMRTRTLPDESPDLQRARKNLTGTLAGEVFSEAQAEPDAQQARKGEFTQLAADFARGLRGAALAAVRAPSGREAEERCTALLTDVGSALSLASGLDVFPENPELDRAVFLASELTRGAALLSATLTSKARADSRYEPLRLRVQQASAELAHLAQLGTSTVEYNRARSIRESAERELVELSSTLVAGTDRFLESDIESLSAALAERDAWVGYRRYARVAMARARDSPSLDSLCAFVLRKGGRLARIELGASAPIEHAVERWRTAIGVQLEGTIMTSDSPSSGVSQASVSSTSRGFGAAAAHAVDERDSADELRALLFDPLLPALEGVDHLVVAPDDIVFLVPLNALPARGDSVHADSTRTRLLGELYRIEMRTTLLETLLEREPPRSGGLLALGDPDYDREPVDPGATRVVAQGRTTANGNLAEESEDLRLEPADLVASLGSDDARRSSEQAGVLRGGRWEQGFAALPATRGEVRAIGDTFASQSSATSERLVLESAEASRESLFALASKARFLHLATHGWFSPEAVRSWSDPDPIDAKLGLGRRPAGAEQVRGMSPMLLCGLALAGANLPARTIGSVPGLVTADEISTLDLSECELAVLSACDTNVGVRRAGQGVASLQKALQMAGARSVITSLWKVPDEATRELMVDFYRRMWVEKKPKWQALWEAKMAIREKQDERGRLLYSTRDWAAWVLTGEPD